MIIPQKNALPPIIIIGMHRSGTSMITQILDEFGLFVGKNRGVSGNNEAHLFRIFNNWLAQISGAGWEHPEPIELLLEDQSVRASVGQYLHDLMSTTRVISYLGWNHYWRYRSPLNLDIPWGWKDPLNTYTLPLWLDLFPDSKIIHIYRNGVDVAASLQHRYRKHIEVMEQWMKRSRRYPEFGYRPLRTQIVTLSSAKLSQGFALWEMYTKKADKHAAALPEDRVFVLRYEDFLCQPRPWLEQLCTFCGLGMSAEHIAVVQAKVDATRAYAYKQDSELVAFYDTVKESAQMKRYSYA